MRGAQRIRNRLPADFVSHRTARNPLHLSPLSLARSSPGLRQVLGMSYIFIIRAQPVGSTKRAHTHTHTHTRHPHTHTHTCARTCTHPIPCARRLLARESAGQPRATPAATNTLAAMHRNAKAAGGEEHHPWSSLSTLRSLLRCVPRPRSASSYARRNSLVTSDHVNGSLCRQML